MTKRFIAFIAPLVLVACGELEVTMETLHREDFYEASREALAWIGCDWEMWADEVTEEGVMFGCAGCMDPVGENQVEVDQCLPRYLESLGKKLTLRQTSVKSALYRFALYSPSIIATITKNDDGSITLDTHSAFIYGEFRLTRSGWVFEEGVIPRGLVPRPYLLIDSSRIAGSIRPEAELSGRGLS